MFLLVPAYPGCPGSKAVKRSLLLLLYNRHVCIVFYVKGVDCVFTVYGRCCHAVVGRLCFILYHLGYVLTVIFVHISNVLTGFVVSA